MSSRLLLFCWSLSNLSGYLKRSCWIGFKCVLLSWNDVVFCVIFSLTVIALKVNVWFDWLRDLPGVIDWVSRLVIMNNKIYWAYYWAVLTTTPFMALTWLSCLLEVLSGCIIFCARDRLFLIFYSLSVSLAIAFVCVLLFNQLLIFNVAISVTYKSHRLAFRIIKIFCLMKIRIIFCILKLTMFSVAVPVCFIVFAM